jgi:hypothetical protein
MERKKKRMKARRGWEVIGCRIRETRGGREAGIVPGDSDQRAKTTGT